MTEMSRDVPPSGGKGGTPWPNAPCGVVIGDGPYARDIAETLRENIGGTCPIARYDTVFDLLDTLPDPGNTDGEDAQVVFLVCLISADGPSADEVLRPVEGHHQLRNTRLMIMCTHLEVSGVDRLAAEGRLDWIGYAPSLQVDAFLDEVRAQMQRFEEHQKPDSTFRVSSLFDRPDTDGQIVKKVLAEIEASLGLQPRIKLPPGVRLTTKGQWLEEVTIILDGRVALIHQTSSGEDIVMHEESTGRIIGLLAISEGRRAMFNGITTTPVTAVRLTVEQMNSAIQGRPDIMVLVATLFIRSLDRRLRRAEELHVENVELSDQLSLERTQLESALKNLEDAREELNAQERLASLGALSAGVAHELNNPMAAIQRISDYLDQDVTGLLEGAPNRKWAGAAIRALSTSMHAPSLSSKEERKLRRELTKVTGDPQISQRLSLAGVRDPKLAKALGKRGDITLEDLEHAASIGSQLRNLASASTRITELVSSLRSYARPDGDNFSDVDIHQNLGDALRLLSHKLDRIEVKTEFANLEPVQGHPGQLAQVWTNLLTNAAEAITEMAEENKVPDETPVIGTIRVVTSTPKPGWVRVEVRDDGPGIPEAILPHIFEPRFTTKSGQVRFGLGIGLGVTRTLVGGHNGTMRICSSPEGTTVIVDLPVRAPKEES